MRSFAVLALLLAPGIAGCPPAFEEGPDCNNGIDDDGDGLVDCADPDCALAPECAQCGNGRIDPGETCDHGFAHNGAPGDSCSRYCGPATCGNGRLDPGEQCDDGNLVPGDGCDARCQVDFCGNRVVDPGEQCDDGNRTDGDGCDSTCHAHPPPGCGNGTVDPGEQCDDGNDQSGDGCSALCVIEFCGDGIVEKGIGEQCDDADPNTPTCTGCRTPVCGNFTVEKGEQCDDGPNNGQPTDPCTADCKLR